MTDDLTRSVFAIVMIAGTLVCYVTALMMMNPVILRYFKDGDG